MSSTLTVSAKCLDSVMVARRDLYPRFARLAVSVGSNPTPSTSAPVDKLVKSLLSKGRGLSVRIRDRVPSYNAEMMELVYMLVLETKSCGFESHPRDKCLLNSVVECHSYKVEVGSSTLSASTRFDIQ